MPRGQPAKGRERATRQGVLLAGSRQPAATVTGLLLSGCELGGDRNVDLRLREGLIAEIGRGLARDGEKVIEALGGAVIPGLHDHHVHTLSLAASLRSVSCGPPAVATRADLAGALRDAARAAPQGSWIRGVGYHESVAGPLDRWQLDAFIAERPLRIQHRSGALWMLNSAGVRAAGLDRPGPPGIEHDASGQSTGRLFRSDRWLSDRVPQQTLDFAAVGRLLAAAGVTGITDATPDLTPTAVNAIHGALVSGALPQHLLALGAPDGANSGLVPGPHKMLLDESACLDVEAVAARVAASHARARPVAIHCVTKTEVVVAIESIRRAGAMRGDRLEHASELPPDLDPVLAELGTIVVTQPNFVAERGDVYAAEIDPSDLDILYRCATLLSGDIGVAAGTDAPFGLPDPWTAMRAAVERRTASGAVLGPRERVTPAQALRLFLGPLDRPAGPARVIAEGAPADLCLLHASMDEVLRSLDRRLVRSTIVDGRLVHDATRDPD